MIGESSSSALFRVALSGRLSRREIARRAAATGLSVSAIAPLLTSRGGGAAAQSEGETQSEEANSGGEIVVGLNLEPDNLDPAVTPFAVSHWVMMNIYDTLVWRANDGTFHPGLAERWEASEDGTVYTFELREGVNFHDGTPFNAEAVKFTFDHIVDPESRSGFAASLLGPYDRTEVVDERTAMVYFREPYAPFLDSASQAFLAIVSPTAVQADREAYLRNPVGTGFMKFDEWAQNDHITLSRNPDYNWASPMFDHSGPAYLDKVTFRFYTDTPTRLAALEAGDANLIETPPYHEIQRLRDDAKFEVNEVINPGLPVVLFLDTTIAPTDDLAVRQAMNYALDRELIVLQGMFGVTRPSFGPLWESTPYYSAEVESMYPYDPERARQLLDEAGWVPGSDGIREKDGQRLTVSLASFDFTNPFREISQALWSEVGIELQVNTMTVAAAFEAIGNSEVNTTAQAWVSSDPVVLTNLFHSKNIAGGFAWSKFSDERLDELLDSGESTIDEEERASIYAEIQRIIMENALIIPYFGNPETSIVYESRYQGVKQDFRNYLWLYDAHLTPSE
ncbi:MAG: ABC transporter substrate-binding protein [Candidatus Binatia bacterium]